MATRRVVAKEGSGSSRGIERMRTKRAKRGLKGQKNVPLEARFFIKGICEASWPALLADPAIVFWYVRGLELLRLLGEV